MVRTWNHCVEILLLENTKGVAAQRVKAVTGCHTLIAVGDYENDLSMFKVADLAVAVGDALPMVKRAADIVIKDCEDDAIADLIDKLDDILPKIKV